MAEAIAISLSAKLAVALSRSAALGLSRVLGVRSEIASATRELDLLRALLRSADDSHHGTDALAAAWAKQVRDAALELEDAADECCFLSGTRGGAARGWVNARAWFALSRRLRKARERLSQLSASKEQYGIRLPAGGLLPAPLAAASAASQMVAASAHFVEKEEVVGFAAHEEQLLQWVVAEDDGAAEPRRTLVSVWGMGGVGKTTLATRVYRPYREAAAASRFDCAAWVAVSQRFTVEDLLGKVLKELRRRGGAAGDAAGAAADYRSLVEAVRDHLGDRRYLVVLDDVWDAHLWDKLRLAFVNNGTGSRVVVTTRSRDVAKAAAPERMMTLEPLPWREAWTLFCNVAFREVPGRTCPTHLQEIAVNVVERCGGLPLAIVSVGNLLALKDTTAFAWRHVRDSLVWDKQDESGGDLGIGEAASILSLSIDDLPHHLRKCFLSCSVYPEDLWIKRKILIRKWVAQGLVEDNKPAGQCTAEDVADGYLDQLVQRSLMQPVTRNEFGRAKRCLIHDLIRELIIHRSREEEGSVQLAKCKVTLDRNVRRIRHLALDRCEQVGRSVSRHAPQLVATIRSLNAFGSELDASFLSHFRLLTVLNLWYIEMNRLPSSVTSLHNLRYLGVRGTLIQELPKELGRLQKLQVLDAKLSMVQRLPSSVANLKSLRHLIVLTRGSTDLLKPYPATATEVPPRGLQNLTSLQTLKYVQANKRMVRSLANLRQMRSLELSGIDASLVVNLLASISSMSFLRRLGVEMNPGEDTELDLESISRPPLKLQKLNLTGRLARGKLPSWICSLTSLMQLRLHGCQIAHDSLLILGALPGLLNLSLISAYRERSMIFTQDSFPTLRKLTLESLPDLGHIAFQDGCLVNLRDLVLGQCTELTETPQGMENLKHIKNLELFGMPTEFVDKLKEQSSGNAVFHNPASSDFYQAPRVLRFVKFIKKEIGVYLDDQLE